VGCSLGIDEVGRRTNVSTRNELDWEKKEKPQNRVTGDKGDWFQEVQRGRQFC